MAQGTLYIKCFQQFFNCLVFEFIPAVRMEQTDILQVSFYTLECFFYKFRRFMFIRTISCDFPVIEVDKNTYVIPTGSYPYICQIAYHNIPVRQIAGSGYFSFLIRYRCLCIV